MFVVTAKTSASNGACAHAWQTAAEYSKTEKLSGCFVLGPACLRVPEREQTELSRAERTRTGKIWTTKFLTESQTSIFRRR